MAFWPREFDGKLSTGDHQQRRGKLKIGIDYLSYTRKIIWQSIFSGFKGGWNYRIHEVTQLYTTAHFAAKSALFSTDKTIVFNNKQWN